MQFTLNISYQSLDSNEFAKNIQIKFKNLISHEHAVYNLRAHIIDTRTPNL